MQFYILEKLIPTTIALVQQDGIIHIERDNEIVYMLPMQSAENTYELIKNDDILTIMALTRSKTKIATIKVNDKFLPVAITEIPIDTHQQISIKRRSC
ncbi:MAG: hypothetical protein EZS28_002840 [Streblomastix strix]|uniref:Uncharacterized protein n=1 Tax=Streblomastix strix TaxID=222440 RepID=A0A5J4X2U4_9EUKA|nr:MAG: hypothetical protein EZS28_002840 [Streblomastix strix]